MVTTVGGEVTFKRCHYFKQLCMKAYSTVVPYDANSYDDVQLQNLLSLCFFLCFWFWGSPKSLNVSNWKLLANNINRCIFNSRF